MSNLIEFYLKMLKKHDVNTYQHCLRVSSLAKIIGESTGLSSREVKNVAYAGMLHDIGKIRIPKQILHKPGPLLISEFEIVEQHPHLGVQLINKQHRAELQEGIISGIAYHHERFGGEGYPYGLCGEDIPFTARIIAIADAFDAMTSYRPYRPKKNFKEAVNEMLACQDSQFDPYIVKQIISLPLEDVFYGIKAISSM